LLNFIDYNIDALKYNVVHFRSAQIGCYSQTFLW